MLQTRDILNHPATVFLFIFLTPFFIQWGYCEYTERELITRLGWAVMLWSLAFLTPHRLTGIVFAGLFMLTGSIDIAYAIVFQGVFTTSSVEAIAQTNLAEASEFLLAYLSFEVLFVIVCYLACSIYLLRNFNPPGASRKLRYRFTAAIFFTLFLCLIIQGIAIQKYGKRLPGIAGAYPNYLKGSRSLEQELNQRRQLVDSTRETFSSRVDTPQTYIFVIGESATRSHLSLFGYGRQTTPRLSQQQDLILVDNMISRYAQTLPSLRVALTEAGAGSQTRYDNALSIIDAANLAGFDTWWISNQQPLRGTYSVIGHMADHTHFVSNDFHGNQLHRFDSHTLPYLTQALKSPARKKLIVIHLMGSHLQYEKRYPEAFRHFQNEPTFAYTDQLSARQKQSINRYDDSIRFTDWVLAEILQQLQQQVTGTAGLAGMVYTSDHGEEVFDEFNFKGHGPDQVSAGMLEVPFLVWLSENYRRQNPAALASLTRNRSKPARLDDLFHFATDLMLLDSSLYSADSSLLSPRYIPKQRIAYGKDYQQIRAPAHRTQAGKTASLK